MTEQTYKGYNILIYSAKGSGKFKDIQQRLLLNLCEITITSRMVENVCNIVFDSSWLVFPRFFAYDSWGLYCKCYNLVFYSLNLYVTYDSGSRSSTIGAKLFQGIINIYKDSG